MVLNPGNDTYREGADGPWGIVAQDSGFALWRTDNAADVARAVVKHRHYAVQGTVVQAPGAWREQVLWRERSAVNAYVQEPWGVIGGDGPALSLWRVYKQQLTFETLTSE